MAPRRGRLRSFIVGCPLSTLWDSPRTVPSAPGAVTVQWLHHLAYHRRYAAVHRALLRLPGTARERCLTPDTMTAFVLGGIERSRRGEGSGRPSQPAETRAMQEIVERLLVPQGEAVRPREVFEALLAWGQHQHATAHPGAALRFLDRAEASGIAHHPDLAARLLLLRGEWALEGGNTAAAAEALDPLVREAYRFPDRTVEARALLLRADVEACAGRVAASRALLYGALSRFGTDFDTRRLCARRLVVSRGGVLRVASDRNASIIERAFALAHVVERFLSGRRAAARLGLDRPWRLGLLGALYLVNYRIRAKRGGRPTLHRSAVVRAARGAASPEATLVTRAMGGIGDFLMMTPGLHALRMRHPGQEIRLAIPRRYFPVFEGNPDVRVVDVDSGIGDPFAYARWFNLTDCPAARYETLTAPRVRRNRIEVFAGALGVRPSELARHGRLPRYHVSGPEREFQREYWRHEGLGRGPVIGIQRRSAESYRDYAQFDDVIRLLRDHAQLLVFSDRPLDRVALRGALPVDHLPLRRAFALAAACDVLVGPDSSLIHLAAALGIPSVAVCGPVDGVLRAGSYPDCSVLDARDVLGCVPCWRNEIIPCRLTGRRDSACMGAIPPERVVDAVRGRLGARRRDRS